MGIQGNLSTMNVSDLLQFLAAGRKTGMLKFDRAKIVKQVYFDKGLIVGSNSNDPRDYLGQLLIHYGKLDESQLKAALETQRKSGGRLGEILVSTKVLPQADVLEVLRIRTLDIIYDLFLWEDAHFELHDNVRPPCARYSISWRRKCRWLKSATTCTPLLFMFMDSFTIW